MSLPRFHLPAPWPATSPFPLPEELCHHALRVLRLRHGDSVGLFDGAGRHVTGHLQVSGKHAAVALIGAVTETPGRAPRLTLLQGVASGDKMDWIIEKATELGFDRVMPVQAQRSVLRLQGERRDKRWQHWQRVAVAACAQCGRNTLPQIDAPAELAAALSATRAASGPLLVCHPDAADSLLPWLRQQQPTAITLCVGPEGGWAPEEVQALQHAGGRIVRFGGHVLRTETAGLVLGAACGATLGWHD